MTVFEVRDDLRELIWRSYGGLKPKGVKKGNKQQISLTNAPTLLAKIDDLAAEPGQSRAAVRS